MTRQEYIKIRETIYNSGADTSGKEVLYRTLEASYDNTKTCENCSRFVPETKNTGWCKEYDATKTSDGFCDEFTDIDDVSGDIIELVYYADTISKILKDNGFEGKAQALTDRYMAVAEKFIPKTEWSTR